MLIGEGPGNTEDEKGEPFVGQAGKILNDILAENGIRREEVSIANVVSCRPPDNRIPTPKEVNSCFAYLSEEVKQIKPEVLVLLGSTALKKFLVGAGGITKVRGQWFESSEFNCKLLPTFHPAYILRNPTERPKLLNDIKKLRNFLDGNVFNNDIKQTHYYNVVTQTQFSWVIDKLQTEELWTFDTETTGIDFKKDKIFVCTFSWKEYTSILIDFRDLQIDLTEAWFQLKKVFENDKKKIAHNGSFDIEFLMSLGIYVKNYYCDTIHMHYLLNENDRHGLEVLAEQYTDLTGYDIPLQQYKIQNKPEDYSYIPKEILHPYAQKDSDVTLRCFNAMLPKIYEEGLDFVLFNVIMPIQKILIHSEYNGVSIDVEHLKKTTEKYARNMEEALKQVFRVPQIIEYQEEQREGKIGDLKVKWENAKTLKNKYPDFEDYKNVQKEGVLNFEFNLKSHKQLKELLIDKMKLPILKKTDKGNPCLDDEVLTEYAKKNKFCAQLSKYRSLSHLKSTFLDGISERLDEEGKVHTDYLLFSTVTGRPSSRDPNLNNIPRTGTAEDIKDIFCADPGNNWLVEADQGQCFSGDTLIRTLQGNIAIRNLVERFQKGEKFDIYSYDKKTKQICLKPMVNGEQTGSDVRLIRITLDNNKFVDATPLHKFILNTGEDVVVADLKIKDLLFPFYDYFKRKVNTKTKVDNIHGRGIKKIEVLPFTSDVYNIEVQDTHTYALACGIIVNNCEFRYFINYSKDPQALTDLKVGIDIHKLTAAAAKGIFIPKGDITYEEFKELVKDVTKEERQQAKNCVSGDTIIPTIKGFKPISSLVVGDVVLDHEKKPQKILETFKREDILYRMITEEGELKCTKDHPLYVLEKGELITKPLSELKEGDDVLRCGGFESVNIYPFSWGTNSSPHEKREWNFEYIRGLNKTIDHLVDNNIYSVKIKKIEMIGKGMVYDFVTTGHKDMIANGFYTLDCVFGLMYGRGVRSIAEEYGISEKQARDILNFFFGRYPKAKNWIKITQAEAVRDGYVTSIFGRKRRLLNINHPNEGTRAEALHQAVNSPIQSAASDSTFLACVEVFKELWKRKMKTRLVLTVYDSLVFNIPDDELEFVSKLLMEKMTSPPIPEVEVPLASDIKIGKNWGSLMEVNINDPWEDVYNKLVERFNNK
jgi:uracil-DNA glycosylase family 4